MEGHGLVVNAPAPGLAAAALPDGELLALLRRGAPDAFAALMRQNNRRLYRLARSILHDDGEAEDVVQESYVRAFTHLDGFKGEATLATWLARIVANEALGRLRRRRPTVELEQIAESVAGDAAGRVDSDGPSPEHAAARREIRRTIECAIDALPAGFRAVFMLRVVEQLSIADTASILDLPAETVKTRLHRANRLLQRALSREFAGILDEAFPFAGRRCERIVAAVIDRLPQAQR